MAECFNMACPYCADFSCKRTATCDVRLDGEYVKVVRCKDCTFWNRYDDVQVIGSCNRYGGIYNKRETDFCSWGEAKE